MRETECMLYSYGHGVRAYSRPPIDSDNR